MRRCTSLLPAVLITAVLAAACGGGDDGALTPTNTTGVPSTSPPATTSPAPTTSGAITTRTPPTTAPATTAPRVNLRSVDWLTTLRGINLFKVDAAALGASAARPYVELTGTPVAGYALLDAIDYGDLNGDGADEALVAVFSGGTAGNTGLLIFNSGAQSGKVELTGPIEFYKGFGYKTGGVFRNGALVVTNVAAAGWEPNCCQSGVVSRTYKIVNGLLAQQGATVEEGMLGARAMTIIRFYELVNLKNFTEAYTYFTPAQQARQPFESWKAGFATTKSVVATSDTTEAAGPVKFRLEAVDTSGGGELKRTFTGTWTLVYSTAKHQWLLDTAEVQLGG